MKFSKREVIKEGWGLFKQNWKFLVGMILFVWVASVIPSAAAGVLSEGDWWPLALVLGIGGWILQMILTMGTTKVAIKLADGGKGEFKDLWRSWRLVLKYVLTSWLTGLIVVGGMLLLIIPGIIWAVRLQYALYFVIDEGLGPIGAIKASWAATRGQVVNLILLNITLGILGILGILGLGVGLLVTLPVIYLAYAVVYKKLSSQ